MKLESIIIILIFLATSTCQNSEWKTENNSIRPVCVLSDNEYLKSEFQEISANQLDNHEFWLTMNHSDYEVAVEIENGGLKLAEPKFDKPFYELEDGKLEIINNGEFGGALNFIPNEHPSDTIEIWNVPINYIFNFKGEIYFVVGIAHMMDSGGAIFKLNRKGDQFTYEEVVRLDSAPEAISVYKDMILIASHRMFTVVENFEKNNIVKEAFWRSLYPNSITVKNEEEVYIGMRDGYSKLSLNSKKVKYFKYKEK